MHRKSRLLLAAALGAAAAAAATGPGSAARAGCLAPADVAVDAAGAVGPFWGNDAGDLLYARANASVVELRRKGLRDALGETLYATGDTATGDEIWSAFHSGGMNERGDAAFVASTTRADDPGTAPDESLLPPRRGVWMRRGNSLLSVARAGDTSPVDLPADADGPLAWVSFNDAAAVGRPGGGAASAAFVAQLGGSASPAGVFRWDESTGVATALALAGDESPLAGHVFSVFGRIRTNEAGDVAFYAVTRESGGTALVPGLFLAPHDGGLVLLVRFGTNGDTAPGGGRFGLLQDFDLDGAGGVVFACANTGSGPASGLYRKTPPTGAAQRIAAEGDATPLDGVYGSFLQSQVRCAEDGTASFLAPVAADETLGVLFAPPGSAEPVGLALTRDVLATASLGDGRISYQTATETRTVLPSDGTVEGPTDFRVASLDLRNVARESPASDALFVDLRFRLPPWGVAGAPVFAGEAERATPAGTVAAASLAVLREVRLQVSEELGQTLVFGVPASGTSGATVSANGIAGTVGAFKVSPAGDVATWKFTTPVGRGSMTVDLTRGTLVLSMTRGTLRPSFDPSRFLVEMTLRTADDVASQRTGSAAWFHRSTRMDGDLPNFPAGRRIVGRGERVTGGTLFVDSLRVTRKLAAAARGAPPAARADGISMAGTLRLCPGSTAPTTPTLAADVDVGAFSAPRIALRRIGKSGSRYLGSANVGGAKATLKFDLAKGTFSFAAPSVAPLVAELPDADFAKGATVNTAAGPVGGMTLPVRLRIDLAYEASLDVAMTRQKGGRSFLR